MCIRDSVKVASVLHYCQYVRSKLHRAGVDTLQKLSLIHIFVPIVTGERRKAKQEAENGKRKYKTKKNKIRLCADDLLTPKKLEEYQTSYAEQMRPFGLSRGVQAVSYTHLDVYKRQIRGGTDGAVLSERGIPCPNIFTSGGNFHSIHEYCSLDTMERCLSIVTQLVCRYAASQALD